MKKFRLLMAGLLVLALALTACSSSKPTDNSKPADNNQQSQAPKDPTTTFNYVQPDKPTTFDPAMIEDVPTMQVLQNVYSGLVKYNEKGEVVADIAKSWTVSDDGLTYTFTLKDAVKFHDGTPVTAGDFVRSIVRAMNPALNSAVVSTYLNDLTGYAKFLETQGQLDSDLAAKKIDDAKYKADQAAAYEALKKDPGVSAPDDKTLVFKLAAPAGYFLGKLTYPTAFVVGKQLPNDKPLDASPDNAKLMIGTGPFKVDSYVEGSKVTLKRFADFYGDKAKVGTLTIAIIKDEQAAMAAYRSGQIDYTFIPTNDYKAIKAELGKEMTEYPSARVNYFTLNEFKFAPAKDLRVRQAVNYAIDRVKFNEVVFAGTQFPAYGILPAAIPGALGDKVQGYTYDVQKGKDLLKQAGYGPGTDKPFAFKLTYRSGSALSQKIAEFIQQQLQDNLGAKVTLDPMEWGAFLKAQNANNQLDSFLLGWSADYIDPQDFLTVLLHSKSDYNHYGWVNKDFDAILEKADHMKPGPDRYAEYSKAEQIAVTDAAWVPLYFGKAIYLSKPYAKGIQYNAMGIMPLNYVEVNK